MKKITTIEIEQVLNTVYSTNISAQTFDALKQFFIKLPEFVEETKDEVTNV